MATKKPKSKQEKNPGETKLCTVCQAKIDHRRIWQAGREVTTCSAICTRARKFNVSRTELLIREDQALGWGEKPFPWETLADALLADALARKNEA